MRQPIFRRILVFSAMTLFPAMFAGATTVLQMNLSDLTAQANLIVRGTIVDVSEIRVEAGGGELRALHYKVRVDEKFKGEIGTVKDVPVAEFKVLGTLKKLEAGEAMIPGWPQMDVGKEYLLFVAPAGPTGLTATMGLGQGCFDIFSINKEEMALNGFDNVGLFKGMESSGLPESGPVAYSNLADQIRTQLGE